MSPNAIYDNDSNNKGKSYQVNPKRASLSVLPAAFIFIIGGMNFALGLGWNIDTNVPSTQELGFSWAIGVIIGVVVTAPLITLVPKFIFMIFSALVVIADGIIFVCVPYRLEAIIAARYIDGIAFGVSTICFIMQISELAPKNERGNALATEQYCMTIGIALQIIYSAIMAHDTAFSPNRVHGILTIVFGLFSLATVPFMSESPLYYLHKKDNALQYSQLSEEMKHYVLVNDLTVRECFLQSLSPLLKMVLYRSMVALTFTLPLSGALQIATLVSQGYNLNWPYYIFGILRLVGGGFCGAVFDLVGRKALGLVSLLFMAGLTLGIGIIFSNAANMADTSQMATVVALACCIQFFAAIYAPTTTVHLGEAFPMLLKPYCIAFCLIVPNVVHIIVGCTFTFTPHNAYAYFVALAVIMFVSCMLFIVVIPETKKLSLLETQERFRKWLNLAFY